MRATAFARAHNDYLDYDRYVANFGAHYDEEPEASVPPSYVAGMAAEIWRIREQADRQGDIALLLSGDDEAWEAIK